MTFLTNKLGLPRNAHSRRAGNRAQRHPARILGFSLIEVLVALVVLSIGLLGVAALQASGLRTGRTAIHGMRAVVLASDIVDRIRANPAGAAAYVLASGEADPIADIICADAPGVPATVDCTAAQMAAHDIRDWRLALKPEAANGLPGSDAILEVDMTNVPPRHTVTITWSANEETYSYTLDFAG